MKQHLFYLGLILLLSLNTQPALCDEAKESIPLTGSIIKGSTRSGSTVAPIEAYLTDAGVDAYFNKSLGLVTITISNESRAIVYQNIVNSYAVNTFSISMITFPSDTYTIRFVCDYGSKTGEFYWDE